LKTPRKNTEQTLFLAYSVDRHFLCSMQMENQGLNETGAYLCYD
jgi:hypothetical protein